MSNRQKKYVLFGTTADVGVRSRGRDIKVAFENQARGMFSIMVDLRGVRAVESFPVEAKGTSNEMLLAAFLEELLFFSETKRMFLREFRVESIKGTTLKAEVKGEAIDPARHVLKSQVKAVTYHGLEVKISPEGCTTRVVYDI